MGHLTETVINLEKMIGVICSEISTDGFGVSLILN